MSVAAEQNTLNRQARTLNQQRHRLGLLALLDKGELLLAKCVLVDETGVAKNLGLEVVNRVLGSAAAAELEALHVTALGPAKGKDAVLDENVERHRVDALLVDHDKRPRLLLRVDVLVANEVLELDNLLELGVNKTALRLDQLFPLLGRRVEERRVDLAIRSTTAGRVMMVSASKESEQSLLSKDARLLVLERDVERQDEAVLEPLGHVRVPGAMVHDEAADERRLGVHLVLHLHDLDHVQVDRVLERIDTNGIGGRCRRLNGKDGVDDKAGNLSRELRVDLGRKRGVSDRNKRRSVKRWLLNLERVEKLRRPRPGQASAGC